MNLQDKIAAIKSDCEERLPDLPRFGGEARARRGLLVAIEALDKIQKHSRRESFNNFEARRGLQAISEAWETP